VGTAEEEETARAELAQATGEKSSYPLLPKAQHPAEPAGTPHAMLYELKT
jgi:hypothetical protein